MIVCLLVIKKIKMDKEKVVVILLLVTIILSISSVVVTLNLNLDGVKDSFVKSETVQTNPGSVNLIVEKLEIGEENETN